MSPNPAAPAQVAAPPLTPLQLLELLCDRGSLQLIRSAVGPSRPGDGVVAGGGRVEGRPAYCFAQDATFAGGSVGRAHADTIVRVQRLAAKAQAPLVGFVASGGARVQEGLGGLDGYGRVFSGHVALSGKVPQISVITGAAAGGGSYAPALTDYVVMTRAAAMFLTGPGVVREVMGQETTPEALGGPRVQSRNGVAQFVVDTCMDSIFLVRSLLEYLPQHAGAPVRALPAVAPEPGDPGDAVPADPRRVYDVREAIGRIVDGGSLLEVAPRWAPNMVIAFARLEGRAVGVVANQPKRIGGVIDAEASQKAARFVRQCDTFGLPLLVFVDTPGFLPGTGQEAQGVIRHGASLLHAFAAATVPRLTVVMRKAFGGAYITMNSRDLGADLTLAWPGAQLGIMGAQQAVGIVHRREIAAAEDPIAARDRLAEAYAGEHLTARNAAQGGHIDEVIAPADTRARLAWALDGRQGP